MFFSIRYKLILVFVLLVSLVSGIYAVIFYLHVSRNMQDEIQQYGLDTIKIVSQMAAADIFESDYITLMENTMELVKNSDIQIVSIMDTTGSVFISTGKIKKQNQVIDDFYQKVINSKKIQYRYLNQMGIGTIEFVSPITALGKVVYLIKTEVSLAKIDREIKNRTQDIVFVSGGIIVLALILGLFLTKMLTSPIAELVHGTEKFGNGELNFRFDLKSKDEIGQLAQAFNKMGEEIEKKTVSKDYVENILKSMEDSLIVIDESSKINMVNNATLELLGVVENEIIGQPIQTILKDKNEEIEQLFLEINSNDKPKALIKGKEISYYSRTGDRIPVLFSASAVEKGLRGSHSIVCVARDLTEQIISDNAKISLENQLRQSQKMEAMGTLAGGIAHEFNNILGIILGHTEMLLDRNPPDKEKKYLESINRTGERAAELVNKILTFGRSEDLGIKETVLEQVLIDVIEILKVTLPAKISIKQNMEKNLKPVLANATQIHQVIVNLCNNAAHAMKNSFGTIEFHLSPAKDYLMQYPLIELEKREYLRLSIKDTGSGIAPNIKERIFDPFFTTKEVGKGTGIGLSVVHGIMKDHKGAITVDSKPGQGSTFHLFFPTI